MQSMGVLTETMNGKPTFFAELAFDAGEQKEK
jgi:hypothetical protein